MLLDTPNEVARHRFGESAGANEDVHAPRRLCEKDGSLPGGVPAVDSYRFGCRVVVLPPP
jgi:hypothetical protein